MSLRSTTRSMKPCFSKYSAVWKSSGSFWWIVFSMTRRPAKPMSALGSVTLMSPSIANEADTPPVVGSVRTEMNASPASFSRAIAADVFAICMSERMPSCMRAPPDAEKMTRWRRSAMACSQARAMRSPVPVPRLPPMKPKSMTPSIAGWPPMVHEPMTMDSVSPDFLIVASTLSL